VHPRLRIVSITSATLLLALACSQHPTSATTIEVQPPSLLIAPNNAAAQGGFTGTVIGHPASGDSVQVSGATVTVYSLQLASGGQDTVANQKPDSIGTLTTGSDGRFSLIAIPAGQYAISVIPPSTSPFREADRWTFVSDGHTTQVGFVGVYPR
jgi:hypothetical protein